MKKSRLIGHLTDLENIRRDEYMPEEVKGKVVELEKLITKCLLEELENPTQTGDTTLDEMRRQIESIDHTN